MTDPNAVGQDIQGQLKSTGDQIKQGAAQAQQEILNLPNRVQQKAEEIFRKVKVALTDYSGGVSADAPAFLMQCYMWASACLIGVFVGDLCGKNGFYGMFQAMFGSWSTLIIYVILIPVFMWVAANQFEQPSEIGQQLVLGASVVLGLLFGSTMYKMRLGFFAPPPALFSLSIALAAYGPGTAPVLIGDRRIFVPVMLAPAAFVITLVGLHQLSSSYFVYCLLLTVAAVVDLQMKLEASTRGNLSSMLGEQWQTVVTLTLADVCANWMLASGSGE